MFSGPCAAGNRKPSQVRKEAALSGPSWAPQSRRLSVSAPSISLILRDQTEPGRVGLPHKTACSVLVEQGPVDETEEAHAPDRAEAKWTQRE